LEIAQQLGQAAREVKNWDHEQCQTPS
jgi:hypothetical protein